jgi:hypothetical protein
VGFYHDSTAILPGPASIYLLMLRLAGIVYPFMIRRLLVSVGFPWAVRALTLLMLGCLVICCGVMRLPIRSRPRQEASTIQPKGFFDLPYVLFVAGKFALL